MCVVKKYVFFICLLFVTNILISQKLAEDSIRFKLYTTKDTKTKAKLLLNLSQLNSNRSLDSSYYFAKQSYKIAVKSNFEKEIAGAYIMFATYNKLKAKYDSAIHYTNLGLILYEKLKDTSKIAFCIGSIGQIEFQKGNYKIAIKNFIDAQKKYELIKHKKGMAQCAYSIANIYKEQGQYIETEKYLRKTLSILDSTIYTALKADAIGQLGSLKYLTRDHDSSIYYYTKQLDLLKQIGDSVDMATAWMNLSVIYSEKNDKKNRLYYLTKAKNTFESFGITNKLGSVYRSIGEELEIQGKLIEARVYFQKAFKIVIDNQDKEDQAAIAYTLLKNSLLLKKDKELVLLLTQYDSLSEELYGEQNLQTIEEINTKYQTEKKDKELIVKQAALDTETNNGKTKNLLLLIFALVGIAFISISIIVYRAFVQKKKSNILIQKQSHEIALQKELVDEKNKDILDSIRYARRIQTSLLPTDTYIKKSINRLNKSIQPNKSKD